MNTKETGYPVKKFETPTKRYCQTLDLKDDPQLIELYKKYHSKEESWPEIREGIRRVGILEMEIYLIGSRLFMIVETPVGFDWKKAFEQLAGLPRQAEWEKMMSAFQVADTQADSAEKWQLMERIFMLYDDH